MRSRLAYTLSFWRIGAVALSVLAMGCVAAWNLRQGFSTYLQTRDFERLDAFVKLLSTHLQQSDPQRLLDERPIDMPALLQQLATQDGVIARIPAKDDVGRPSFRPESGPPARGRCAGRHREAIPINLVRGCRCFISMDNRGAAAPTTTIILIFLIGQCGSMALLWPRCA
jgi:hypothetical protein